MQDLPDSLLRSKFFLIACFQDSLEVFMISIVSLWLPILLYGVAVFVLSSLVHMV
jgi:hypothetical protein